MRSEELALESQIPAIDDCCDKETYAFFGLAAYLAQVLEHSALNLAIVLKLPGVDLYSSDLFEELYEDMSKKTFGRLLNATKSLIEISDEKIEILFDALETRNFLIHEYFRENAENFVSEIGKREMKEELQQIIAKFKKADLILENIYSPLWEKYGITEEFIQKDLEELRRKAEIRDGNA